MSADKQKDDERPPLKPYKKILEQEIQAGLTELARPASGLFLSSVSAGLDLGFSVLLMAMSITFLADVIHESLLRFVVGNMYAVGFILVILGRSELFTEHTTLAVLPVLNRNSSIKALMRVWGIVLAGNTVGGIVLAGIIVWFGPRHGLTDDAALVRLAKTMTDHSWWVMLISAILAGWLMGELAWLMAAARETVAQILCVWIVTAGIGVLELHHAVVGSVEVLVGVFASESLDLADYLRFLLWTVLGNTIGGVCFVAIVKYGHVVRGGNEKP